MKIKKKKILAIISVVIILMLCFSSLAFAKTWEMSNSAKAVLKVLNFVFTVAQYVGIILFVAGVAMMVMAFKSEDADSKVKSTAAVITAIVLIALKSLLQAAFDGIFTF